MKNRYFISVYCFDVVGGYRRGAIATRNTFGEKTDPEFIQNHLRTAYSVPSYVQITIVTTIEVTKKEFTRFNSES